ncbi:MAG: hypothetical protein WC827_02740 [Candidatus Paceibacterota bacterium]|jgi:hypothetical protein
MYEFISTVLFVVIASMISYYFVKRSLIPWNGSAMLVTGDDIEHETFISIPFGTSNLDIKKGTLIRGLFFPGVSDCFIPRVFFRNIAVTYKLNNGLFSYSIEEANGGLYLMLHKPVDSLYTACLDRYYNNEWATIIIKWCD